MKKIVQTTLAASITLALAACGSSSSSDNDGGTDPVTPSTLEFTGQAIKGTLANALVEIFSADNLETPIATTQTDENGDYSIEITDESGEPIVGAYVVNVTADEDTTMICDASVCGDVVRGETIPAEALVGLTLSTVAYSNEEGSVNADVNALTSMAATTLLSSVASNENLDLSAITAEDFAALQTGASQLVLEALGLDQETTNLFAIDIIDATEFSAETPLSDESNTLSLINASFSGLGGDKTISEQLDETLDALDEILIHFVEEGEVSEVDTGSVSTINNLLTALNQAVADINAEVAADTGIVLNITPLPTEIDLDAIDEAADAVTGTGATGS